MSRKDARERMTTREPSAAEQLALERLAEKRRGDQRRHRKLVRELEREIRYAEERADFLEEIANAPAPKPLKVRAKGRRSGLPEATFVTLASDWHVGERVRPANIGGRNEYSPAIAQERAQNYWEAALTMLNAARAAWRIPRMVLWLGGDLMTGYLRDENRVENYLSPTEEALLAFDIFVAGIQLLLDRSDCAEILIPTSNGNHGRTTQRIQVSSYARESFEHMLYKMLQRHFQNERRVRFCISDSYENIVDLYGFRIRFHHGDAIGYAGGVGGLSIPTNRRIGRQASSIPIRWEGTERGAPHLDVFGHFHQLMFPGKFIVNGSLIGYNDFAVRIGAPFEEPQQGCFVVDAKYQTVSQFSPLVVDRRRR